MTKFIKKIKTIIHLDWKWAYKFYKKKFFINLTYYIAKIKNRSYYEMTIDGAKVKFSFSNPYQHHIAKIYNKGTHETQLLTMWKKQVEKQESEGGVILDLGGYVGVFGLLAAVANRKVRVYIFEPDPVNVEQIKNNIICNNLTNVSVLQMAIADIVGEVSFAVSYRHGNQVGGGTSGTITKTKGDYQIECTTIDAWVEKNNLHPILIKIDIEGAEYRGLLGARQTLSNYKDIQILLELHQNFLQRFGDSPDDVYKILSEMGYKNIWLDKDVFCTHYWVYKTQ